jgi:hypothetical protein
VRAILEWVRTVLNKPIKGEGYSGMDEDCFNNRELF